MAVLKPLIRKIRFAFDERGHDAFLQLWTPGHNPKGSFVSLGIRKKGKQKNGNRHAVLYAFGFFYETAFNWPADYVEYLADRAVAAYAGFLRGAWPTETIHEDDAVLKGNANVSAPIARKTHEGLTLSAVQAISPTKAEYCDVKKLNAVMETALKAPKSKQQSFWAELETEEVDPLS